MTIKEILAGLQYRINSIKESVEVIKPIMPNNGLLKDWEARVDELESVKKWIKENEYGS